MDALPLFFVKLALSVLLGGFLLLSSDSSGDGIGDGWA